jgi:hypothetical protein
MTEVANADQLGARFLGGQVSRTVMMGSSQAAASSAGQIASVDLDPPDPKNARKEMARKGAPRPLRKE